MAGLPMPSRRLVVVVDDTLPVRLLVSRALSEAGLDVLTAPDGAAAATLILGLRSPPDLVITDMRMPAMGGEEFGRWVGLRYPQVPLISISGFITEDTGELPGTFLSKPFTPTCCWRLSETPCPLALSTDTSPGIGIAESMLGETCSA